ncbi:hypothetical protein AMELA_G00017670 [Ameiurus melas]|uniref:Uncharacterized protein n=1 Tax=Ameiurus melas TaxID=219545 RepID=A0A7J6BCD8_AMEME|nr:hypothetical protein AMELA_G00017670 [Ameiurus melas]
MNDLWSVSTSSCRLDSASRLRVEHLERELKEVQDALSAERERERMQVTAKTLSQHDELMKTETMNVLVETNKMLRDEKERLEQDLQQAQARVSKLQMDAAHSGVQRRSRARRAACCRLRKNLWKRKSSAGKHALRWLRRLLLLLQSKTRRLNRPQLSLSYKASEIPSTNQRPRLGCWRTN